MRQTGYILFIGFLLLLAANVSAEVNLVGNNNALNYSHWLPKKAYVAFNYDSEGNLSSYRAAFQADGGELFDEWKLRNDNNYEIPFPFVVEVTLIVLDDGNIDKNGQWGFGRLDGNNSNNPASYIDSSVFDFIEDTDKYGIGILSPHQLQEDVIYDYWMGLDNISGLNPRNIPVQLRFRLNIDLSEAKKFGYTKGTIGDDFELGNGWEGVITKPFGYRAVDINQTYSPQDIGDYFSFAIKERKGSDLKTYSDYFVLPGMEGQWCKERNGNAYQVNSVEECFGLNGGGGNNSGNGTDENPQIFTEGNHTHILAPSYRCSKATNGPILCWESGLDPNEPDGRRNCWNAWKWYQFNGEVNEVVDHRTDSDWITTLDRSMCAVVYNSSGSGTSTGGDASNITEGTGNGYTNDQYSNPWAGYDHDVGLNYLKIGKKSSNRWTGSKVWSINRIPDKRDFRAKLKRKGGKWKDVCTEVWFSHNKYFTDDDKYLGKECKKLSKKKYRKKKKKSVYVKNVSIPKMEAGKNYYFFTRVTYHGGVNPSSRSDNDEYVKVEIIDFSSKFKIDKISGETPLTINFTNQSRVIKNDGVSGTISYFWDFGDGSTSTAIHPSHTYTQVGTYIAKLTTTASWGEVKTSTATIVVTEPIPDPPVDTDLDGVIDDNELGDTDGDGIFDYQESYLVDTDNDGVNDQLDSENTNPANDSDADGYTNEEEKLANTNPLSANSVPNIPDDNDEGDDPVDLCQETAETATNGGWGWNPVTEEGCLVNYLSDDGSDENDSDDYCHETADTATNGGWGWNPVTQEGCLVVTDSNDNPDEGNCEATSDTAINGGWGWNSVTQEGCLVDGSFDETEDDTSNPEDYCHETSNTATNGGWGWNPVTEEGCLVDGGN